MTHGLYLRLIKRIHYIAIDNHEFSSYLITISNHYMVGHGKVVGYFQPISILR